MSLFPEITDWRINPANPTHSVFFKEFAPVAVSEGDGTLDKARELFRAIQSCGNGNGRFDMELGGHWHRVEVLPNGVMAVRVIPDSVPSLEELKIPPQYRRVLLSEELTSRGGLVVIAGGAGSGKTTTAVSTIVGRLNAFGGYGLIYENPMEYRIQGFHGSGYLDQNPVTHEGMVEALTKSMRCLPVGGRALIYVGEILDPEIAMAVFHLMMNGHTVFTTSFGTGIIECVERLCTLLDAEDNKTAREMLATNLRWVFHQQLSPQRRVIMRALEITRAAEQLIAHGQLLNLKDEISRTEERLERAA